jgi:alpha-glucuronidase
MNPLGSYRMAMVPSIITGPAPWINDQSTWEWNPVYYHKADSTGGGFDRTATGSITIAQYFPAAQSNDKIGLVPALNTLLWFPCRGAIQ